MKYVIRSHHIAHITYTHCMGGKLYEQTKHAQDTPKQYMFVCDAHIPAPQGKGPTLGIAPWGHAYMCLIWEGCVFGWCE